MKWLAGMAPQRRVPEFAPETFRAWFARRPKRSSALPKVVLYADTFNNHFHTETAQAAVEVLEAAGFRVTVPRQHICCGRPLYDYGMLDLAKKFLRRNMRAMLKEIRAGVPIGMLEPSCCAVFRDELPNMFPSDQDAMRLTKQTFLLSEFLIQKAPQFALPKLNRNAIVQTHCHHKSVMGAAAADEIFEKMGVRVEQPEAGCCGMAGSCGFEPGDHYEVSRRCGERDLLPAVREAPKEKLVIADGFSCKEQIRQGSDRQALHLAQVIQMAMRDDASGPAGAYPERKSVNRTGADLGRSRRRLLGSMAAGFAVGCIAMLLFGKKSNVRTLRSMGRKGARKLKRVGALISSSV
jgi:Fe-S oxidoreductase